MMGVLLRTDTQTWETLMCSVDSFSGAQWHGTWTNTSAWTKAFLCLLHSPQDHTGQPYNMADSYFYPQPKKQSLSTTIRRFVSTQYALIISNIAHRQALNTSTAWMSFWEGVKRDEDGLNNHVDNFLWHQKYICRLVLSNYLALCALH